METLDEACETFRKQLEILNRNPEKHEYAQEFAILKEEFRVKVQRLIQEGIGKIG